MRSGHQRAACPIDPAARKGGAVSALSSPLLHSTRPALPPPFPRACRPHDDCSGESGQTRVRFPLGRKYTTIRHSTTSATSSARNLPYGRARRSSLCSCRPRAAFGGLRGRRRLGARAVDAAARERRVSSSALGPRRRPSLLHRALLPAVARAVARSACARGGRPAESSPSTSEAGSVADSTRGRTRSSKVGGSTVNRSAAAYILRTTWRARAVGRRAQSGPTATGRAPPLRCASAPPGAIGARCRVWNAYDMPAGADGVLDVGNRGQNEHVGVPGYHDRDHRHVRPRSSGCPPTCTVGA